MVIFGRNRLRLRQRAPFPWTSSRRLSVLSAQVLKNAGRLRCPDPSSLLSINSSGCSRASFGGWPTFRFLKGWLPRAYPAWDLWILRMLARSCISVGTGEDEKEARRCMSPRLPTFAKTKAQRWATHPPMVPTEANGAQHYVCEGEWKLLASPINPGNVRMVAGGGFEPPTFRLSNKTLYHGLHIMCRRDNAVQLISVRLASPFAGGVAGHGRAHHLALRNPREGRRRRHGCCL